MRQRAIRTYAHAVWLLTSGAKQPFTVNREPWTICVFSLATAKHTKNSGISREM